MKPTLAPSPPVIAEDTEPRRAVRRIIGRHFFATAAALALLAALVLALMPLAIEAQTRWTLVLSLTALAALAALSMRAGVARVEDLAALVLIAAAAAITLAATLLDWGIAGPGLGFFGVLTCMVCALAGLRLGLPMALLSAAVVLSLAGAQARGWLPASSAAVSPESLGLRTVIQLFVIGVGLAGGMLVSRVISRYVSAADEREQRFRSLLGIAADAYWEIDADNRLVTFKLQGRADRAMGIDSAVGQVPWEMPEFQIDEETLDLLRAHIEAREAFSDLPVTWLGVPGQARHFVVSGGPRDAPASVFRGYWGVARDVTAEVRSREALAATESRYQDLFDRIPTPLVLHAQGHVLDANPAALDMFGYADLQSMLGQDLLSAYEAGDSRERARRGTEALQGTRAGEALPVAEFKLVGQRGRRIVVRGTGVRVDAHGAPAVLSIFVDDTERKKAEDAVRRSEAMLSHLVATSPDVITLTDLITGRFAMVNRTFEQQIGYSATEVVGRTAIELGIWSRLQDRERFVSAIREHGEVRDMPTEFVTKSGATRSMLVSGARFAMDRRDYLVINARDVSASERDRLEREAILQNASIGIAVTREQRFVLANPRFEQMYGWPSGALVGQSGRVVWDSDEDYRRIGATLGPLLARGESAEVEIAARRFDGSTFLARVTGKAIDPTHPAKGGTIWIVEDVTEQRQVQQALARARDEAEAANRAKSAFLANTSHELRTPLNGLLGLARMAASPQIGEEQRRQHLLQIGDTAQALSDIISDILDLSKIEAGRMELDVDTFDVPAAIDNAVTLVRERAQRHGIALGIEVAPEVGEVRADERKFKQILLNLLTNAVKFTLDGGRVDVRARIADGVLEVAVADTGIGIAKEDQAAVFEEFRQVGRHYTNKQEGTGLGLTLTKRFVELHGGTLTLDSEPGRGSTFTFTLPSQP